VRVAGISKTGGPVEIFSVSDPPAPGADEVTIQVRAAGVGNWDEVVRIGGWDVHASPPMALGVEAAGVVDAVGAAVTGWGPGDEVITHPVPLRGQGTWAPWLLAPADLLAVKPATLSWEAAAGFPIPALTAHQTLAEALRVQPGETVLVNGAGGVTGRLLVSLAVAMDARVIAVAGPTSEPQLLSLGADAVLDYHRQDWPRRLMRLTESRRVDAVANAVRDGSAAAINTIRDGGRLATITSDPPPPQRGIEITSVYVRADGTQLRILADRVCMNGPVIEAGSTFPLVEAEQALALATRGAGGRVVSLKL
jgi:NADPH:quinone reductase-like Zn-dependent oxidoreductase